MWDSKFSSKLTMKRVVDYGKGYSRDIDLIEDFWDCLEFLEKHPNSKVTVVVTKKEGG